jgi:transcriptional regulator with XRE-family HTH domain
MDDELKLAFGEAVRKFRTARGLSQEKLAERANIHRTYIGDVERGLRNIALVNMHRIAAALEVSLSTLIGEMEKREDS